MKRKIFTLFLFVLFAFYYVGNLMSQKISDARGIGVGPMHTSFTPWGTYWGQSRAWHWTWRPQYESWITPGGTADRGFHGIYKDGTSRSGGTFGSMLSYWCAVKNWKSPDKWVYDKDLLPPKTTYEYFVSSNGFKASPDGSVSVPTMYPERTRNFNQIIVEADGIFIEKGEYKSSDNIDAIKPNMVWDDWTELEWTESVGVTIHQNWYAYLNADYDDFFICDMTITNEGKTNGKKTGKYVNKDQVLEDFWFGIGIESDPYYDSYVAGCGVEDELVEYYGSSLDDSLKVMYFFDGNSAEFEGNDMFDPRGSPKRNLDIPTGEYVAGGFAGLFILHVDRSGSDESNDTAQPAVTRLSPINEWKDPQIDGQSCLKDVYEFISGTDMNQEGGYHQEAEDPFTTQVPAGYRLSGMIGFGPFTLQYEEEIRIVWGLAVGSISESRAIELGYLEIEEGYDPDSSRHEVYLEGRKNLFSAVSRAKHAFKNDYDVPRPPLSPNIYLESGPQRDFIRWDPVEGAEQYCIYYHPSGNEVYKLANEEVIPSTQTEFIHENLTRGIYYRYYITAVDVNGLESSHYMATGNCKPFRRGVLGTLDSILVVPNPFNAGGGDYRSDEPHGTTGFNYAGSHRANNRILFVNLPQACTIRIYNSLGDLIKTLEHTDPTADEAWDPSITDYHQYPASGIYYYTVEGKSLDVKGKIGYGKFIIIR